MYPIVFKFLSNYNFKIIEAKAFNYGYMMTFSNEQVMLNIHSCNQNFEASMHVIDNLDYDSELRNATYDYVTNEDDLFKFIVEYMMQLEY